MKTIIQRVTRGSVTVNNESIAQIDRGLVVLLGISSEDTENDAHELAKKIASLRIFEDPEGKMNLSCLDVKGEILVVSQFTLLADTSRGRRPSFVKAAKPDIAKPLCDHFIKYLQSLGIKVQSGAFGSHMKVEIVNDGPVTIVLDQPS